LEEDLLKIPAVAAFSETLGVDSSFWTLELKHYADEPDVIGAPVFDANRCRAPFRLRYVEDLRYIDHLNDNLVVTGIIYIDDNQSALIGTLTASSTREISCARERLVELGIDPDTLDTVDYERKPYRTVYQDDRKMYVLREQYEAEMAAKMSYLDYLEALLPQQRRETIFYLTEQSWGDGHKRPIGPVGNPVFMRHPKLAPELHRLEIPELSISDVFQVVGPVEFAGGQCTVPIMYPLYGDGKYSNYDEGGTGYYVEVHILAGIGNKPGGGGDIWVKDLWSRIVSIDDDPPEDSIPLLVP
jgi:hypothetical protein